VLTWLSGQQVDALLSVGDIVDGAGSLDRCCDLLAAPRGDRGARQP
jgi:hypothetical protein